MSRELLERVRRWIVRYHLLPLADERPVVVGVSGGPDSVALAHMLRRLGYPVHLAHLDHGLREDSAQDAKHVEALAREWGVPFHYERAPVPQLADQRGASLEAVAREVRYTFLFRVARRVQAQAVSVGHTLDDQAETILLHLLRGSGLTGLQGMRPKIFLWDPNIPLVRPLLGISRGEILTYCQEHGLTYRQDPTNQDLRFTRNRIRHRLLPLLERDFNPRVKQALARLGTVVHQEVAVLEELARQSWEQVVQEVGPGFVFWSLQAMRQQPPGLRYHLWRRMAQLLQPGMEMALEDVERAEDWLLGRKLSGPVDWFGGLYLALEPPDRGIIARWGADLPTGFWPQVEDPTQEYVLAFGERLPLAHGWALEASFPMDIEELWEASAVPGSPQVAWLDADTVANPLRVRARRPGDRFAPLGMAGHTMKLSDFFINVKLPRRARERWPLVVHQEHIVWIPGYRLAHPFRVRPDTRRVLRLRLLAPTSSPE